MKKDMLKPFKQHGVTFRGANASQAYGDCPFTGKKDKFYVNKKNGLWDSKTAGYSGNLSEFLEKICQQNKEDLTSKHLKKLSQNRGIPVEAFKYLDLGYSGAGYTFPCRDEKGILRDLRSFRLGKRVMGTAGCPVYLFGVEELVNAPVTHPVYLCEGEWDTIAMRWLIKKTNKHAVVVGVPGANTFKSEWVSYFRGRDIIVCYDNDEAGELGEVKVKEKLTGYVNSLVYLHWALKLSTGYDIRDLISHQAVKMKKPKRTISFIEKSLRKNPRKEANQGRDAAPGTKEEKYNGNRIVLKRTFKDVEAKFNKWLHLENTDPIRLALAANLSVHMPGDPVWIFFTSPPGGAKTEIINAFNNCKNSYVTSSLTPRALISGSNNKDGSDPSMLPRLNMKNLYIKDFTVILGKKEADKEEMFSIFRDAYDGSTSKDFGNTVKQRAYKVHFNIFAGVTPIIYNSVTMQAGLGERFLKYHMGDAMEHVSEMDVMRKAIGNVSHEFKMRNELSKVIYEYVTYMSRKITNSKYKYPEIPSEIIEKLLYAVQYGSIMRGTITRDVRNNDIVLGKPFREVGTRFSKNLAKLLIHDAVVLEDKIVTEKSYEFIRKIVLDTVDQRAEEVIRKLYVACPDRDDSVSTREVGRLTRYNTQTIVRIMNDFNLLGIVDKLGKNNKFEWTVSKKLRKIIERAGFYETKKEKERVRGDEELFEARQNTKHKIKIKLKRRK